MFGNRGCVTPTPELSERDRCVISELRELEDEARCSVNPEATRLGDAAMALVDRLAMLDVIPLRSEGEGGCIGYLGPELALRSAPDLSAPETGTLLFAQNILFSHAAEDGWEYVLVTESTSWQVLRHGWVPLLDLGSGTLCRSVAG